MNFNWWYLVHLVFDISTYILLSKVNRKLNGVNTFQDKMFFVLCSLFGFVGVWIAGIIYLAIRTTDRKKEHL